MRSNRRSQQPAVLSGTPGNRGLTAPLLTDEELRREEISSRQHQYRQQDLERGSDGTNIRLLYAAHNEEDFQREMEEERERERRHREQERKVDESNGQHPSFQS